MQQYVGGGRARRWWGSGSEAMGVDRGTRKEPWRQALVRSSMGEGVCPAGGGLVTVGLGRVYVLSVSVCARVRKFKCVTIRVLGSACARACLCL